MISPTIQELLVPSKPLGGQKGQRGHIPCAWHCGQQTSSLHFTSKCDRRAQRGCAQGNTVISQAAATDHRSSYFDYYALAVLLGPHIYISRGVVHLVSSGENANWPLQLRTHPVEWPQVRPTPYHVLATGQMQLFAEKYNAGIGIWWFCTCCVSYLHSHGSRRSWATSWIFLLNGPCWIFLPEILSFFEFC